MWQDMKFINVETFYNFLHFKNLVKFENTANFVKLVGKYYQLPTNSLLLKN